LAVVFNKITAASSDLYAMVKVGLEQMRNSLCFPLVAYGCDYSSGVHSHTWAG